MKTYYCTLGTRKLLDGTRMVMRQTYVAARNAVDARRVAIDAFQKDSNAKRVRARRIRVELVDVNA